MLQLNQVKERFIFLSPTVQAGKEKESSISDFKIVGGLGAGAFGKVYKVEHKQTKQIYALKQISKQQLKHQKMINQIKIEIKIMYSLHHPNIVKLYNHFEENDYIYLIIEFAEGGQLWDKLNRKGRFDEKTVQQYMREMVAAIDYCHSRNPPIIHRDIKPENILLDKEGHIKLADFGWSNFFNPGAKRKTYCGTLDYLAPEMIEESGHDVTLDYWSLGVLTFELLTGKAPFTPPSTVKDQKQMQQILEQNILKVKIEYPKDFPPLAKDLVGKVLKKNPKQRCSIDELKDHPWLRIGSGANPSPKTTSSKGNFIMNLLGGKKDPNKETKSNESSMNTSTMSNQSTDSNKVDESTVKAPEIKKEEPQNNSSPLEDLKEDKSSETSIPNKEKNIPIAIQNPDAWSEEELKEYSSRSQSIINKPAAEVQNSTTASSSSPKTSGLETNKAEELFQRFSVSYNKKDHENDGVVEELNTKVKNLKNEVSELEVKLKLKDKELEELKKENERMKTELTPNMGTPEGKRIAMLEEDKQKLKKEIDDIWQKVEVQEADLQKKNLELKKFEEIKAGAEKYKTEKSALSKQIKELQTKLNQANGKILELQQEKEDEKNKYEKLLKENEIKGPDRFGANEQQTLKELVEFARTSMDEMQMKINYYKEKSDSIEKLERDLSEKKSIIVRLEVELQEKVSEIKRKMELEHDEEKKKLLEDKRKEIETVETRYKELIRSLENEIASYKGIAFDKEEAEAKIENFKLEIKSLKTNNETLSGLCTNLQTLKEDNEKKNKSIKM